MQKTILQIAIIAYCFVIYPVCLGMLCSKSEKKVNSLTTNYLYGYIAGIALFFVEMWIALSVKRDIRLMNMAVIWLVTTGVVSVLSIGLNMKSIAASLKIHPAMILFGVLSIAAVCVAVPIMGDDTAVTAMISVKTDTIYQYNPYTEMEYVNAYGIFDMSIMAVMYGVISLIVRVSPVVLVKTIVPVFTIFAAFCLYEWAYEVFFDWKEKIFGWYMAVVALIMLMQLVLSKTCIENGLLLNAWNTNTIFFMIVVPFILCKIIAGFSDRKHIVMLIVALLAGMATLRYMKMPVNLESVTWTTIANAYRTYSTYVCGMALIWISLLYIMSSKARKPMIMLCGISVCMILVISTPLFLVITGKNTYFIYLFVPYVLILSVAGTKFLMTVEGTIRKIGVMAGYVLLMVLSVNLYIGREWNVINNPQRIDSEIQQIAELLKDKPVVIMYAEDDVVMQIREADSNIRLVYGADIITGTAEESYDSGQMQDIYNFALENRWDLSQIIELSEEYYCNCIVVYRKYEDIDRVSPLGYSLAGYTENYVVYYRD